MNTGLNSNRQSTSSVQANNMRDFLHGKQEGEKSTDRRKKNLRMSSLRVIDVDLNT